MRILGVGLGVIILGFLWALTFCMCVACSRSTTKSRNAGPVMFFLSLGITVFLLILPRESLAPPPEEDVAIYDMIFYWRVALLGFLCICVIVGLIGVFTEYLLCQIFAGPLPKSVTSTRRVYS